MKPKARYDARRGLWLVHGGNLRDGCSQYPTLGEALAAWQRGVQFIKNTFSINRPLPPIAMTMDEWADLRLPPGKLYKTAPSPIELIQQLENVIETQKLEIAHCHAVCDELRQQLNQSRRSIWGLTPASGPHWSGKQS